MPLRWSDIPLESKVGTVLDTPGWFIEFTVPAKEEWLILSWQVFQHVTGPNFNAVYKRMTMTVPNDWDSNFVSYIVMEKGVGGVDSVDTLVGLGADIGRGIEVSGGKTLRLEQVAGETANKEVTCILNALVRRV